MYIEYDNRQEWIDEKSTFIIGKDSEDNDIVVPALIRETGKWISSDGVNFDLLVEPSQKFEHSRRPDIESLRKEKRKKISEACEKDILEGFYSSVHYGEPRLFGFDERDQANYIQGLYLIDKGVLTTTIPCKCKGGYYEDFTIEEFKQLAEVDAQSHKIQKLLRCDELKKLLDKETTEQGILNIIW